MKRLLTLLLSLMMLAGMQAATFYQLYLNGTQVSSNNYMDLTGISGVSGTAYYMASQNTLYLQDAMIVPSSSTVVPLTASSGLNGLKINVTGTNSIRTTGNIAMWLNDCGDMEITGGGTLFIESVSYDIFFANSGHKLTIKEGTSVYLMGGGIDNDGNYEETLEVNNANLFVRRANPSMSAIFMRDLVLTNAYLEMPYWKTHEWTGSELTSGSLSWHSDIYIKAGAPSEPYGYGVGSSGDANADGVVTLSDVTALVNQLLGKNTPALEHEYVDLGLPSGTLWATTNIGAAAPEEYGLYFAWGETKGYGQDDYTNATNYASMGNYTKTEFSFSTYKWCQGTENTLTKYTPSYNIEYSHYPVTDGKTSLDAVDDAAYQIWGSGWRMPTKEQWEELINNCTEDFRAVGGVLCHTFTGPNGNSIILPPAGYRKDTSLNYLSSQGFYWSRTRYDDVVSQAPYFWFSALDMGAGASISNNSFRCYGLPIRPVRVQ